MTITGQRTPRAALAAAAILALLAILATAAQAAVKAELPPDPGWPRSFESNGAKVIVHQPQIDSWENFEKLKSKAAVEVTPKGETAAAVGAVWLEADTSVDFSSRTVSARNLKVARSFFPGATDEQTAAYAKTVAALLPKTRTNISLDRILAYQQKAASEEGEIAKESTELAFPVPDIYYSDHPAALVMFDGPPIWKEVPGAALSYGVNTNWDIFQDARTKGYYLLLGDGWLASPALTGPWGPAGKLPESFSKLPDDDNFKNAKSRVPGQAITPEQVPAVYVSERPAECIVTTGAPQRTAIPGTSLSYVPNCDSDVFYSDADNTYYYLVSGRWFATQDLARGPWRALKPDELPKDFAKIPADGPKGPVLASVPGTAEADYAVLQAKIPQKATLSRKDATVNVAYSGEPKFEPIKDTSLSYAVNTPYSVIKVEGRYYCCHDGAWFVSDSPKGPWKLADHVPGAIYAMPPSSPVYNTTYVKVYDATAEAVVFGYMAGYMSSIICRGVVVFGTGYYYPPYVYGPAYFPRPYPFGMSAYYNPYTGLYNRGAIYYGPYGGYGRGAVYNPYTGGYVRAGGAWGPYGGTGTVSGYNPYTGRTVTQSVTAGPYGGVRTTAVQNPYTGRYAVGATSWGPGGVTKAGMAYNPFTGVATSAGVTAGGGKVTATATQSNLYTGNSRTTTRSSNGYANWGSSVVSTPDRQIKTGSYASPRREVSGATGSGGAGTVKYDGPRNDGRVVKSSSGDMVVGNDGNVYKRQDGQWSKVDPGSQPRTQQSQAARQNVASSPQAQQARDRAAASPQAQQRAQQARDRAPDSTRAGQFDRSPGERPNQQVSDRLDRDFQARNSGNQRAAQFESARRQADSPRMSGNRDFGNRGGGRDFGGGRGGGRRR